ncbi:nuclear transport factor 2 family protein [Gemmatimonas groenlandica]|uniref:Nuclear transport factor 2 family protein n=1 Tax=Gemmatimonas groenlandica TaxID=2732249 RepID=A0A6M4IGU8_9BACT|nr:nuclear transport factor 2 family protein [Gemmatimonas groenlandica]QJR34063.1 nuclear transport factor 2 family protein [Gemmatimonas groenlandica]
MTDTTSSIGALAEQFLQCVGNRDAEGAGALFADRVDWYVGGNPALAWTGRRSRGSDVTAFLNTMWPHFRAGASTATLEQSIINGDDAVIFASFVHTADNTGRRFETPVAIHLRASAGRLVLMHLYEDTWAVSHAFFD